MRFQIDNKAYGQHAESCCQLKCAARTVTGKHDFNEDAYMIDAGNSFFAVSDGIGGAPYGDIMSIVACNSARDGWIRAGNNGLTGRKRMHEAIAYADDACSSVSEWLGGKSSGATIVTAACEGSSIFIASVGDSAAFEIGKDGVSRITELGRRFSTGRTLSGALGYRLHPRPQIKTIDKFDVDALLLCTDGIWESASHEKLRAAYLSQAPEADNIADAVVDLSNKKDDATALVLLPINPQSESERA